LSDILIYIIGY